MVKITVDIVNIFVISIALLLSACTPAALLDTIERNSTYTVPSPPKTKQLKLVIALNGNYDIGKAAMEKLMAYYQVSDTLEVYERLTGTIAGVLGSDHLYLPKNKTVAEVAVVRSDDFPVDTRQINEKWRTGSRVSELKTSQPADMQDFLQNYTGYDYALFCGDPTVYICNIGDHKMYYPGFYIIIPHIVYEVSSQTWVQQGFARTSCSALLKDDNIDCFGKNIGYTLVNLLPK